MTALVDRWNGRRSAGTDLGGSDAFFGLAAAESSARRFLLAVAALVPAHFTRGTSLNSRNARPFACWAMPPSPRRNSLASPPSNPTSTSTAPRTNPDNPRTRYQSGHVLDHIDSYVLRGEDTTHSPGESRLPSPVPSIRCGGGDGPGRREEEAEERTLTSGSGNGGAGRDGLDDAEKGLRSRKGAGVEDGEKRRSSKEGGGGELSRDPATRQWKNDVVTFDSKDDPANPKNWTFRRRYFLVALLGMTTMCSTFASSIFSTATPAVAAEFGVSTEVATLGTCVDGPCRRLDAVAYAFVVQLALSLRLHSGPDHLWTAERSLRPQDHLQFVPAFPASHADLC